MKEIENLLYEPLHNDNFPSVIERNKILMEKFQQKHKFCDIYVKLIVQT